MERMWVNSADSHVLEPPEIWRELPEAMRDRAPLTVKEDDREIVYIDGKVVRRDPLAWVESFRPPGARDLAMRMKDLDDQGIWAECVFPSMGIWVTLIDDPELYAACARVYNDWLAADVNGFSERLIGAAIIPTLDTGHAVAEIHRCAELGYKTVSLAMAAPAERRYNQEVWEPVWAAIEETGLPVCFHAGTGSAANLPQGPGGALINYVNVSLGAEQTVTDLVAGGVLDRHRELKVFMVEVGAAWLPWLGDRMDEAYRQHGFFMRKFSSLPSEQIRRQVYVSFQHDKTAVAAAQHMGLRTVMWGSDYPHLEGTYPRTQEVLQELFDGIEPEVRQPILIDTFTELFRTPPPPSEPAAAGTSAQGRGGNH